MRTVDTPPPGRERYEELYRPEGMQGRPDAQPAMPPRPRHFQPALTPPELQDPDDTYGWLYRTEPEDFLPSRCSELPSDHPDLVPLWNWGRQPEQPTPVPLTEILDQRSAEPAEPVQQAGQAWRRWPLVLIGLVVLLVVTLVLGSVLLFHQLGA